MQILAFSEFKGTVQSKIETLSTENFYVIKIPDFCIIPDAWNKQNKSVEDIFIGQSQEIGNNTYGAISKLLFRDYDLEKDAPGDL